MAHIVKVAAAAVVVVVLKGGCGCNKNYKFDTEIHGSGEDKQIHQELINETRWFVNKIMFMAPLTGFQGVRAEVTTNKGKLTVWFPIMDHCTLDHSRWWEVIIEVDKHINSTLTFKLKVSNCSISCNRPTTGATHTSGTNLKFQKLELFGRGASSWRKKYPTNPSPVPVATNHTSQSISCTDPPPIGSLSPSTQQPTLHPGKGTLSTASPPATPSNASESLAHQTGALTPTTIGVVVVVVMVVVAMVVVVVILMVRRRGRQENEEGSQQMHTIQEVQVTRNSLYESFDQLFSRPGRGDAPPDTQR